MSNGLNEVETALYSKLTGASSLTSLLAGTAAVYNGIAPEGASYPYVLFAQMSGVDDHDTSHRARQLIYVIQGVSKVGLPQAGSIDAAVDALLHMVPLSVSGWSTFWIARESDVRMTDFDAADRTKYFRSGGTYRLRISQ